MATVHICLSQCLTKSKNGVALPVALSQPKAFVSMTTSSSNQQAEIIGSAAETDVWQIAVSGGDVMVKFGSDPDATSNPQRMLIGGFSYDFGVTIDGEDIAVVDA
jgi:hypothetical protein